MSQRYLRLSVLLFATLLILSAGLSPALAQKEVRPVDIQIQGAKVQHRLTFEIVFSGFVRFFQTAQQRVNPVSPLTSPPPPAFEPIDAEYLTPTFWLGKLAEEEEPEEPAPNAINDSSDPVM